MASSNIVSKLSEMNPILKVIDILHYDIKSNNIIEYEMDKEIN